MPEPAFQNAKRRLETRDVRFEMLDMRRALHIEKLKKQKTPQF